MTVPSQKQLSACVNAVKCASVCVHEREKAVENQAKPGPREFLRFN